jgi:methylated-DNA-protein-cysteine methyltransferase related protein
MAKRKVKAEPAAPYREKVYRLVRRIPSGRVMTYGQIALILGEGYTPRTVGFVMHGADAENTPWHRVINSQGGCSTGRVVLPPDMQQRMLETEGVQFDAKRRCDLGRYVWLPDEHQKDRDLNAKDAKDYAKTAKRKHGPKPSLRP